MPELAPIVACHAAIGRGRRPLAHLRNGEPDLGDPMYLARGHEVGGEGLLDD
jgi:hypothetical protein